MYTEFLTLSGFSTAAVGEGSRALQMAVALHPDVIVTDIVLPGEIDGLELTRLLRRDPRTKDVAIVVLSGREIGGDNEEAEAAGCDLFLSKPCLPDKLASELRRVTDARQHKRA